MVFVKTRFVCEMCNTDYADYLSAETCEKRGFAPVYPTGLIFFRDPMEEVELEEIRNEFSHEDPDERKPDRLTSVDEEMAENRVFAIAWSSIINTHDRDAYLFVGYDRKTPHEVLTSDELVNIGETLRLDRSNAVYPDNVSVQRMAQFLLHAGTTPTYWDGEKVAAVYGPIVITPDVAEIAQSLETHAAKD